MHHSSEFVNSSRGDSDRVQVKIFQLETATDCLIGGIPKLDIGSYADGDVRAAGPCPHILVEELIDKRITVDAAIAGPGGSIAIGIGIVNDASSNGSGVVFGGGESAFTRLEIRQITVDVSGNFRNVFLID